ncbi:MAG: hypothetical protein M3S32_03685 [Acidobacteriota bacterium]|nr:hypothetical protein [Acidobacteriota bacterium]
MIGSLLLTLFTAATLAAPETAKAAASRSTSSPTSPRTSVGRDLTISEPVNGNVVAVFSDVTVGARVSGNVIVWGGDVRFNPAGSVDGNLSVFGGDASPARPGALPVSGRVSTPGSLLRLYLEEMHRAPWESAGSAAAARGLRMMALSLWLLASLLLLWMLGSPFARAAAAAERDWAGALLAGALGVLTLFLAAAAALALLPSAVSVPIALVFAALAVAAKVFGMAALFLLLGQKVLKNVSPPRRPAALACGFGLLAAASLLPLVGGVLWSAASIVAVGIAFSSRFGTPRIRVGTVVA